MPGVLPPNDNGVLPGVPPPNDKGVPPGVFPPSDEAGPGVFPPSDELGEAGFERAAPFGFERAPPFAEPLEQLRTLILNADQIMFGEDLEPVKHMIDVPAEEQRYDIEKQLDDLLDNNFLYDDFL